MGGRRRKTGDKFKLYTFHFLPANTDTCHCTIHALFVHFERKIQDLDYEEIIFCTIFPLVYVKGKISLWSEEPTCVGERAGALGRGDCWSCCQPRWKTNCEEDTLPVEYCLRSRFSWQYTIHHSASLERIKFHEKLQDCKAVSEILRSFSLHLEKVLILKDLLRHYYKQADCIFF